MTSKMTLQILLQSGSLSRRRAIKPNSNKSQESLHRQPHARNPRPSRTNSPTPIPLIMREMPNSSLDLLLDHSKEWSPIINKKVEDAVLVWEFESRGVDRGEWCGEGGDEV